MRVVYHVAGLGSYRSIVTEQLTTLRDSGLVSVDLTHVGDGVEWVQSEGERLGVAVSVVAHSIDVRRYERPAIEHVQKICREGDSPILYMHSKGCSRPDHRGRQLWRRLMMSEVVTKWRENVSRLSEYDCVGCNWLSKISHCHFSGNIWIASAAYLRRLPPFKYSNRFSCEWFIGSGAKVKPLSLVTRDLWWWGESYDFDAFIANYNSREAILGRDAP